MTACMKNLTSLNFLHVGPFQTSFSANFHNKVKFAENQNVYHSDSEPPESSHDLTDSDLRAFCMLFLENFGLILYVSRRL